MNDEDRILKLNEAIQNPEFREKLISNPKQAADEIGVSLTPAEVAEIQGSADQIRQTMEESAKSSMPQGIISVVFAGKTHGKLR